MCAASYTSRTLSEVASRPGCRQLFLSFLRLGVTAFGGPSMVAYIRQMAVEQRRWLAADVFDDGVALCQVIPGATAMQTAAYVGLHTRGVGGAMASFVGFGLPAFVLMMVLSALYQRTQELPAVVSAFTGLQAVIVALVANATISFSQTSIKRWPHILIAVAAAGLFGWKVNPILVIALAGLLGLALIHVSPPAQDSSGNRTRLPQNLKTVVLIMLVAALGVLALWLVNRRLFELAILMFRIDLFAFGGGFSSVPLLFHETVEVRHWLEGRTLLNGIVLGQITPGPIVITATFVGYLLTGVLGGLVASISIFLPSFLVLVGAAPYFDRLRGAPIFIKVTTGVLCSFVGLLLAVTIRFGQEVAWDWRRVLLAVAAFAALRFKINILWVVLAGAGISLLLL